MSLTRIGSIGINTGIKFSGLTTITTLNTSIDTLSIGGPVSIAGTLTYEDVTNIDSVGLITARNGIVVGSGITLSKDGDIFATGVTTSTTFVGNLTGNVTGTIQTAAQTNITSLGTLSAVTVSGGTNPANVTHTGGNGLQITRGSKTLGINANFGGSDTHSTINVDSGMSLRLQVNASDKIVMDSNGRLGIGDIAPDTSLHVKSSDNVLATFESTDADSLIEFKDNGTSDTVLMGALGGDDLLLRSDAGSVKFHVANNNEKFRIGPSGQIGLSGANYGTSGQVLKSQGSGAAAVWGDAGLTSVSQWRLNTNRDIPANSETVLPVSGDAWYEMNAYGYGRLGSAMTESSGVFTFPSTGIWRIEFTGYWGIGNNGSSNSLHSRIQTTTNNSSYSTAHEQQVSIKSDSTYTYQGFYNTFIFDVTDTSTHKVRFTMFTSANHAYYKANSSPTMTGALFTRLGDT